MNLVRSNATKGVTRWEKNGLRGWDKVVWTSAKSAVALARPSWWSTFRRRALAGGVEEAFYPPGRKSPRTAPPHHTDAKWTNGLRWPHVSVAFPLGCRDPQPHMVLDEGTSRSPKTKALALSVAEKTPPSTQSFIHFTLKISIARLRLHKISTQQTETILVYSVKLRAVLFIRHCATP